MPHTTNTARPTRVRRTLALAALAIGAAMLAGCATMDRPGPGVTRVPLVAANGAAVGHVDHWEAKGFSHMRLTLRKGTVPAGPRGMHFHAVGRCDGPDFQSAGGHWNPTGRRHGHLAPDGPHVGDWGNLAVRADRDTEAGLVNPLPHSFVDADGTSLVIHAGEDDLKTDPSGNSGARIACAVLAPPR